MNREHRKAPKILQIVDSDESSSVMDHNMSRDFEVPWFIKESENSITPDDSISQVPIDNKTKLEIVTLQTKIDQNKERHELELAKLDIQRREELLTLKMELALANAKLDIESECGSNTSQTSSRQSHLSRSSKTSSQIKSEKHSSSFQVGRKHLSQGTVLNNVPSNQPVNENNFNQSLNSTDDMLMTVVRELKKPKTEIDKFSGDIMLYKKFLRQFNYIVACIDSYDEKMNLLEFYTDGEAGTIVNGFGHMESEVGYDAALEELKDRYGDEEAIASAYIDKALAWPKITNSKELDKFAIFLSECEYAVGSMSNIGILDHRDSLKSLVKQLPYNLHDKWGTVAQNIKDKDKHKRAKFHDLVKFVKREARKSNDPTFGREALSDKNKHSTIPKKSYTHHKVLTTSVSSFNEEKEQLAFKKPCLFCNNSHKLSECRTIAKKLYQERIDCLKSARLCYGCLKIGHSIKNCKTKAKCDICSRWHPTILHDENFEGKHNRSVTEQITSACSDSTEAGDGVCTMNIIPVVIKLKGSSRTIKTYAFKDSGSSATFCTTNLMNQLGVTGKRRVITINTMGLPYSMTTFVLHNLQVMDLDMKNSVDLPIVYTKDKMPVTHELIPTKHDISAWDHLKNIELPQINAEIGLLIGNRIADAYTPLKVIYSEPHMPHACLTKLGWSVCNLVRSPSVSVHSVSSIIVNRCEVNVVSEIDTLEQLLHKSINFDFPENPMSEKLENSFQDKQFLRLVDSSIEKMENGHYQIALPFKSDNVTMPNNFTQAEHRLKLLKYRFQKQPKFKADYVEFMNKIINNGYASKISEDEDIKDDNSWYIPHHGVYNPNKPKIRVVFDCSAKFHGISLNQMLLSGPDLTSKLLSVLLRFRQEPIALLSDITSMYYMVYVPEKDSKFLRFLWYPDGDIGNPPAVYKMRVHLFGATSSPSCAISALQRTAKDHETTHNREAVQTILRNFYVDDCLRSVSTETEAIKLVKDLNDICNSGGFQLSKWMSNSRKVLETIPVEDHSKELKLLNLDSDKLPVERALGVFWTAESDTLGFKIHLKEKAVTKRGILSTICSIYDPIGLAAPLILPAKIILQNLCQLKLQWDEPIPSNIEDKWNQWLVDLPNLEKVSIQRCYKPNEFGSIQSAQLHSFADACEVGYGAGIYLRQINSTGEITCSLVLGKSRVTPLKRITIPRLELTAATTALRLSHKVINELDINFDKSDIFYWTDSESVLRYLANTTTRFQTFVANRIDFIRESSELSQWKHVDSKSNVADDFSRGISTSNKSFNMRWLHGPDFLWKSEEQWPVSKIPTTLSNDDIEVKKSQLIVTATTTNVTSNIMSRLLEYHSSWSKLKTTVAWLLHGMSNLLKLVKRRKDLSLKPNDKVDSHSSKSQFISLTPDELDEAEHRILKYIQRQHFPTDISNLQNGVRLQSNSKLLKLDPYLKDGLLRVGGRLKRSKLASDIKNPIILPKDSCVSSLVLQDTHVKVGHLGRNSMLTALRQKYWMLKANTAIRSLVSKCMICRHYRAKAGEQKMSDLPADRLIADEKPFTVTGVDYFGPYEIKQGRSLVKRYGVIFTCVRTRAVHIELAYSLDTDACFNVIRRFVNRRGPVKVFKSDNGSNFIATNKQLKEEFSKLDFSKLGHLCLNKALKWEFNPPTASHFGGIWERQIRTIRKILFALFKEQCVRLSDDSLQTLFSEVESIINSRPITRNSEDPNDLSVLTPNNLLLSENIGSFPLGTFDKKDNFVRRKWRQVQYISDIFWKRWCSEYLVSLQERQKWYFPKRNFCVNDIVLLIDNTVSRNSWCLGRIIEVIRDKNDLIRIVKVQSRDQIFERPIDKLCLLLEADKNLD